MRVTDIGVVLSFLAIVVVVAKMLRAFRLLEARVTLLQEEIEREHGATQKAAKAQAVARPVRTPVLGIPVTTAGTTPRPVVVEGRGNDETRARVESRTDPTDDEIAWAFLAQEQERLRKAMGRDFQARRNPQTAAEIRGVASGTKPASRLLSARELAAKLERK